MKDYYKILEVSPTATLVDIKKSYRRLAFQYHPDKNFGTDISEARFKEIQEAYRVLSDAQKRQEYNRSTSSYSFQNNRKPDIPVTPQSILFQTIGFRKKIAVLDGDRLNKHAVYQQVQHILSEHHIQLLQKNTELSINRKIVEEVLICCRNLPFVYVEKISFQLASIAGSDNELQQKIFAFAKRSRLHTYWNKYKVMAAILITLLFCLLIFIVGKNI